VNGATLPRPRLTMRSNSLLYLDWAAHGVHSLLPGDTTPLSLTLSAARARRQPS
jgi:hypothetical protein